jgi:hypothetical protein
MKLVVRERKLNEREVGGSALKEQAHVSNRSAKETLERFLKHEKLITFERRHSKPAGFYTSSAAGAGSKRRSDWYGFMNSEHYGNAECILIFAVNPSAKVELVENLQDFDDILKRYGRSKYDEVLKSIGYRDRDVPAWDMMAKSVDGFRITRQGARDIVRASYGWDVEQTVWFNTSMLTPVDLKKDNEVTAPKGSEEWYKQKYDFKSQFETSAPYEDN